MEQVFEQWKGQVHRRIHGYTEDIVFSQWKEGKLHLIVSDDPPRKPVKIPKKVKIGEDVIDQMDEIGKQWGCPNTDSSQYSMWDENLGKYDYLAHYLKKSCGNCIKGQEEDIALCLRVARNGKYIYIEEHPYGTCTRWPKDW